MADGALIGGQDEKLKFMRKKPGGNCMALYAVIDVTVKDREKLKEYVAGHLPSIERYGGRIVCRGFEPAVVTGDWMPQLMVIHEWPDLEQFRRWYDSEEYRPWRILREEACDMNMVLLNGLPAKSER